MNIIKTFESFKSIPKPDDIIKKFNTPTEPVEPFQRSLTEEETKKMDKYFTKYSWSKVDNKGRIVLGGGIGPKGSYYIRPSDLEKLD
jgi:hypothetical protein